MKISTTQTSTNISKVIDILATTPQELARLSETLTAAQLTAPLTAGEWSFQEQLTHLIHCETVTTHTIQLALILDQPHSLYVHPQRELSKLHLFNQFSFSDLLTYFNLRRTMLLSLLNSLNDEQWAREIQQGEKRPQTVYKLARTIALHEHGHLQDLASKLAP